jgi:hypothetical protein
MHTDEVVCGRKLHTGVCGTDSHLTGGRIYLFDNLMVS